MVALLKKKSVHPNYVVVRRGRSRITHGYRLFCFLFGAMALAFTGCHSRDTLPTKSSKTYSDFVSAFYTGLAALQVGDDVRAESELARATQLVPGEPAAVADWGVLALRQRNYEAAAQRLQQALKLAPRNDALYYLMGLVEADRGRSPEAIADLRKAVDLNPKNLIATYQLAEEIERQNDPNSDADFQKLIQQIVQAQPGNVAALLELSRIAAKRGDNIALKATVARIHAQSQGWPPEVQAQLAALESASSRSDTRAASIRATFLRNVLMRVPSFRQNLAEMKPAPGDEAQPFTHFLRMGHAPLRKHWPQKLQRMARSDIEMVE